MYRDVDMGDDENSMHVHTYVTRRNIIHLFPWWGSQKIMTIWVHHHTDPKWPPSLVWEVGVKHGHQQHMVTHRGI